MFLFLKPTIAAYNAFDVCSFSILVSLNIPFFVRKKQTKQKQDKTKSNLSSAKIVVL